MTEKRFQKTRIVDKWGGIYDSETDEVLNVNDVEHKLNEQQTTIEQLESDKAIAEDYANIFEKENVKLRKKLNNYKAKDIHKWSDGRYVLMFDEHTFFVFDNEKEERMTALQTTKRLNKQQDTIFKLQDLCGKSDGENMKLRIENKRLQEEIKLLKPTNIEQYEQIVRLQEENEQLRQSVEYWQKNMKREQKHFK